MSKEIPTSTINELRSVLVRWFVLLALIGTFAVWATCRMASAADRVAPTPTATGEVSVPAEPEIEYWTCTMHPQVQQPEPGDCPICGMALVEKYVGSDEPGVKPPSTGPASTGTPRGQAAKRAKHEHEESAWYRCTMPECGDQGSDDPNSRCPVCGMKRERMDTGGGDSSVAEIKLGERARRLAEVATEPVEKRLLFKRIRTVGRVGYDETRYKMVSAWVGGRIDKLFADFSGMRVNKGDHLVEIYSPELLSAQEEYLQALRSSAAARESSISRRSSEQVLRSARRKLELLGITDRQINAIERSGEPTTHLVVYAPIGGTIVEKKAMEGMYVDTGDTLYTIADLTHLWLLVDLYEADLPWVKPFQHVRVTTRSLPGQVFHGQIVFVAPRVDTMTRTVEVRIHVDNPKLRLKPDMWVTAEIDAALARDGRGAIPAPEGDYACPMHPWETSDQPGICPVCEMDLLRVEEMPQYTPPTDPAAVLSLPRGAVMQTGQRALVYLESEPGVYRGVEVTIGPSARDESGREYYPVLSGLSGGESVVTRGNFAIDSQMQLAGKPSLFSARGFGGDRSDVSSEVDHQEHMAHPATDTGEIVQTLCPVMGGKIDPEVFIEFKGVKVYFCCWGCDDKFLAEPEKYIPKLPASLQQRIREADTEPSNGTAKIEQTICPVMGREVDSEVFTDYRGVRVYFCCPPCIEKFNAEPAKYIEKLPAAVVTRIRQAEAGE